MLKITSFPTLIAEATHLQGDVTFLSTAQVYGIIEGDLIQQSGDSLQIGRTGWVAGAIVSQGVVLVEGRVDGDIKSSVKIQLMPSATVRGKLQAPAISVRAGAIVEGALQVLAKVEPAEPLRVAA